MTINVHQSNLRLSWEQGDDIVLNLDPLQGHWTEQQYLLLTDQTNRLLEYADGTIEVLPMPTRDHQAISRFLLFALFTIVQQLGGTVFYAPLRVQVRPGKYREPDLLVLLDAGDPRNQNRYWLGADLVVEIVSPDDPERDTQVKVLDYAEAGIAEYWIVNPLNDTITVLVLADNVYVPYGVFHRGEQASSQLIADFRVSVDEVFDATS